MMRVAVMLPEVFPAPPTAARSLGMISMVGGWVGLGLLSPTPGSVCDTRLVTFWGSDVLW